MIKNVIFDFGNVLARFDPRALAETIADNGEDARALALDAHNVAVLDSTLSDWFVFEVPHDGDYTYTIHNIDVGCEIYFSKQQPRSSGEGNSVANEDNYSGKIRDVKAGELVYFEIHPYYDTKEANGEYIIVIEEKTE